MRGFQRCETTHFNQDPTSKVHDQKRLLELFLQRTHERSRWLLFRLQDTRNHALQAVGILQEINTFLLPLVFTAPFGANLVWRGNRQDIGVQMQVRVNFAHLLRNFRDFTVHLHLLDFCMPEMTQSLRVKEDQMLALRVLQPNKEIRIVGDSCRSSIQLRRTWPPVRGPRLLQAEHRRRRPAPCRSGFRGRIRKYRSSRSRHQITVNTAVPTMSD